LTQEIKKNIQAASMMLVVSIFLSRILGFVREWVLAQTVGASQMADVYLASFTVPDFLNYLMAAGALNVSLIPVLAAYVGEGKEEVAKKVYRSISTALCFVMLVLILACQIWADKLAQLVAPGFSPNQLQSLTLLLRIIVPAQFFFFWGGLANGVQQTHGRFIYSAVAPLIYNTCIILFGVFLHSQFGVAAFSFGVLCGAATGYGILQWWGLSKLGYSIRPSVRWDEESKQAFKKYLWMSIPIMFAFSLVVADEWISKYLASFMGEGAVSKLSYARTEMRIPIAIIGQAAGIASYPHLSRMWAQKKYSEFGQTLNREIEKIWALGPIAAILMLTHALPITHFIYGGGKLTSSDLAETAQLLQLMGLGVVFWIMQILISRGFYATQTTWLPSLWGTAITFLFIPVYRVLSQKWGIQGLAISGTIGISFYVFTLSILLRRHMKQHSPEVSFKPLLKFCFSWSLALVLIGGISYGCSLLGIYQSTRISALLDIGLACLAAGATALVLLRKVYSRMTEGALF